MKKNQELTVITKTYDLIVWTVNHTSRFPRNHRHVLGLRIEQHLYDVLELLIEAKFSRQRREQLEATNRKLAEQEYLLKNDVRYLEKVLREELNVVRPDETVYKLVPEEES